MYERVWGGVGGNQEKASPSLALKAPKSLPVGRLGNFSVQNTSTQLIHLFHTHPVNILKVHILALKVKARD